MKKIVISHLMSILIGGLLFTSVAFASNINVQFLPFKYFINNELKIPLNGQEGFIYKGRTYVPLRFLSESLGFDVTWDRATSSIHITMSAPDTKTDKTEEEKIFFTGTWKSDSGSEYNLKQNGPSLSGTFTHYYNNLKYEFPVTGIVNGKNIVITWIYNDAEAYKDIKNVPFKVAKQVKGISETAMLTLNQETNNLEGYYFRDYVEWDSSTLEVLKKFDGNSPMAINKVAPLQFKLYFKKPV